MEREGGREGALNAAGGRPCSTYSLPARQKWDDDDESSQKALRRNASNECIFISLHRTWCMTETIWAAGPSIQEQ